MGKHLLSRVKFFGLLALLVVSISFLSPGNAQADRPVPDGDCNYITCGPTEVECCGANPTNPVCDGEPWFRIEYKMCSVPPGCTWIESVIEECYNTDVCHLGTGYPSHDGGGKIDAGHCELGVGASPACWFGGWYKSCCKPPYTGGFGVCDINAPYDNECNGTGNVITSWDPTVNFQTCTAYCNCSGWTNQSCGSPCASTERRQTRDCPGSPPCDIESHCVADATCTTGAPSCSLTANPSSGTAPLSGTLSWSTTNCSSGSCTCTASGGWSGSKSVPSGSQGYGPISSTTTYNLSCTNASGTGTCGATVTIGTPPSDPCAIPCAPGAWWAGVGKNCGRCGCGAEASAQCPPSTCTGVYSSGTGWNCCPNPAECGEEPPPPPQYHKECSGGSCVTVEGAGSDQCSSNAGCRHYDCDPPGGGVGAICREYLTPGEDKCSSNGQCWPPVCVQTVINWGAEYTNTRDVYLTTLLADNNPDEMRLRNQSLAWSAWEDYWITKNWTLSAGVDGPRSVTAQYKNDIPGESEVIAACTGSIILDTTPPISSMTLLPAWSTSTPVALDWSGLDNIALAGELKYWLQFSKDGGLSWIALLGSETLPTDETSWSLTWDEGVEYCFRVKAVDPAGNWEDWPWPYDTCTTIDLGIEMHHFGWDFGESEPNVWVSVFDGVSGINYSALQCWYSSNGGSTWTSRPCNYLSTDPTTVSMLDVPFTTQSGTQNEVRFKACDVAGNCLINTYTVDNRTTGAWVQTFGGDIHGNANLWLRKAPD